MANDLATTDLNRVATATRLSSAIVEEAIPGWVDLRALDCSFPYGYGLELPTGCGDALREAAAFHLAAMSPSDSHDRNNLLLALRSSTIIKREHIDEADATLKMLRIHLEDVPLDILAEACRAYCNVPGDRFFPKAAGQLREFTQPLMYTRRSRATRLARMAEQADRADARAAEMAADPLTPEAAREIMAQHGIGEKLARIITPGADAPADMVA